METTLQLRVPVDPRCARVVRDRLVEFATRQGLASNDVEEFMTAVGEAFANAIEHAGSDAPIEILLKVEDGDKLLATISDHGQGFETADTNNDLPPAGAERGRGIPLMRRYTDIFSMRSRPGCGTVVLLGRYMRHLPPQRLAAI